MTALAGAGAEVPVVNLLSDRAHPTQALGDLLTIRQCLGALEGKKVAFIGDANNVCRSLTAACVALGAAVTVASAARLPVRPGIRRGGARRGWRRRDHRRPRRGGRRRRRRLHRRVGVDGRQGGGGGETGRVRRLRGRRSARRPGGPGGDRVALPARPPRRGDLGRCARRTAQPGLVAGGESQARDAGLFSFLVQSAGGSAR